MRAVDTTYLIDLLRGDSSAVKKAKELDEEGGAATTAINLFEITYGVYRSKNIDHNRRLSDVNRLFSRLDIFPLDARAATEAGKTLGALSREGKTIDVLDGMIAAIAVTNGCDTIITRNVDHFKRIPNLEVETY